MTSEYANPDILVDGEWLESHLDDPNIRIVDCDMFDSYQRAHIKGAVGIKVHHYIKHPNYPDSPTDYPWVAEPDVAKQLFQDMGIGDETTVVSYDSNGSLWAARFWCQQCIFWRYDLWIQHEYRRLYKRNFCQIQRLCQRNSFYPCRRIRFRHSRRQRIQR